jgi:protein phosphatase
LKQIPSFGHGTHIGKVRKRNEDCYGFNPGLGVWLVADGLGGHADGDVASRTAVEAIIASVHDGASLESALEIGHQAVLSAVKAGLGKADMGTTAVALKLDGDDYDVAWVGDSRAYLWNGETLTQISRDHSMMQDLMDIGMLSEKEARTYPVKGVLTRTLGVDPSAPVKVDHVTGHMQQQDLILLCSDGLTGQITDEGIARILAGPGSNQEKINVLIKTALENGGSDNITTILVGA